MAFHKLIIYIAFLIPLFISSQTKEISKEKLDSISEYLNKRTIIVYDLTKNFEYNKALTIVLEDIKLANTIKDERLIAKSYFTYGTVNVYLNKRKQAIQCYKKAESYFLKTKDYNSLARTNNNIGWAHLKQDSSLFYYKKALFYYNKGDDNLKKSISFINIGSAYIHLKKYAKAEESLKEALDLLKKEKRKGEKKLIHYRISNINNALGQLYKEKKEFQKALKHLAIGEKIALKHTFNDLLLDIYINWAETYNAKDNHVKALYYFKKRLEILNEINIKENARATEEMATKFEAKEQQSALEKVRLENSIKENEIKNSKQLGILTTALLIFSFFVVFLLYRNNKLKFESNKLLEIKQQNLKNLQLKAELFFLKSQIQPHFFFNTLNNLYALILVKSDQVNNVIQKLRELMGYALDVDDIKKITTCIQKEINSVKNYLELESLRNEKIASTTIQIIGKMDNIQVPPLLYITFIENCFKHNNVSNEKFKIFISFKNLDSKYLLFTVQNTLTSPIENEEGKKVGIGIENIKRRLELIYKEDYELIISTENNMYSVYLKTPILKIN